MKKPKPKAKKKVVKSNKSSKKPLRSNSTNEMDTWFLRNSHNKSRY